jgi:phosphomannomutase
MALVLDLSAAVGRPLSEIVSGLPGYVMIKRRLDLKRADDADAAASAVERVARRLAGGNLNTDDGVRLDVDDGWVHLRPSNTEPIVRLIAEAKTRQRALALIELVGSELE